MTATRHERVYHAAHQCQAASLSLTLVSGVVRFGHAQLQAKKTPGFWLLLSMMSMTSQR